jgi:protein-disulfide isomerase
LVLALPVIAVVVIVASSGPSVADNESADSPAEARAIMRTKVLFTGIPQHGAVLGDPKAPVTLQFFADLQCKESRQVMLGALPFLIRHWVRDGKLRIVYRSIEVDTPSFSEFRRQQVAALAAGGQGKMWVFIDLFYREQHPEFTHYADDAFLEGIAEEAGVDMWRWSEDRETQGWAATIESDELLAKTKNLPKPPSFLIGPTGEESHILRHFSLEEPKVFDEAIRGLL